VFRFRICIGYVSGAVDPPKAKNTNRKGNKLEISCFLELHVLTGGLQASRGVWKTSVEACLDLK
jgi:hypothetical protein